MAESSMSSHFVQWYTKLSCCLQNCTPVGSSTLETVVACHLCQLFWLHLNRIPCSLLLAGHWLPGWCGHAVFPDLSVDWRGGYRVWQSFIKGLGWKKVHAEKIIDGQTWKFRDLDGKGWLWPLPVTPSLTAFSRLQQEEPRTLSPHLPVATTASAGPQPLWMLPGAICWISALVLFLT